MQAGLYIFYEDEFEDPIYADPTSDDLDEGLWEVACEAVQAALGGEGPSKGHSEVADHQVGWRTFNKLGVSFAVVVSSDVHAPLIDEFLQELARRYFDDVDDAQSPDRPGVADIDDDVIPPWEEDD